MLAAWRSCGSSRRGSGSAPRTRSSWCSTSGARPWARRSPPPSSPSSATSTASTPGTPSTCRPPLVHTRSTTALRTTSSIHRFCQYSVVVGERTKIASFFLCFFPTIDPDASSQGERYFFAVRPAGGVGSARRATASGRWRPAGKEKPVALPRPCGGGSLLVGVKRAMAFVPRRKKKKAAAAAALAIGWVMHEYRLAAPLHKHGCSLAQAQGEWVVCRVFQKGSGRPRRRRQRPVSPSPSSASSCVTDGSSSSSSDMDEVSS
eukprot:XP_020407183.1 NAC domain-containing protein 68 isoform X2 [Zea mays]